MQDKQHLKSEIFKCLRQLNKTKIAPRETAKLKIAATHEILNVQRPRVLMITNDPEHPKVVININAK